MLGQHGRKHTEARADPQRHAYESKANNRAGRHRSSTQTEKAARRKSPAPMRQTGLLALTLPNLQ